MTFKEVSGVVYFVRDLGGAGSGNFGHAGRPGERGGSAAGGGGGESSNKQISKGKLSQSEKNAIQDYSGDQFQELNSKLRSGDKLTNAQEKLANTLDSAIGKSEPAKGEVYRTITFDTPEEASKYVSTITDNPNKTIKSGAFLSASESKNVWGYNFADYDKKSVRITINSKTGGKVSKYSNNPNEKEVIFKRGTEFKLEGVKNTINGQPELVWTEK